MIGAIIMGALVGWIAGKLMNLEGGLLRNIVVGVVGSFVGSLVFGALSILRFYVPFGGTAFGPIYDTVPYIATVLVLIAVSIRQKRESQPPAHLGVAYFREER